jgi:hypothetical protein
MAEKHACSVVNKEALTVRPAMGECGRHGHEVGAFTRSEESGDPAHQG